MEKEYIAGEPQRYEIGGRVFIVEPRYRKDGESMADILLEFIRIYDSNISGKVLSKALIESGVGLESLGRKQDTLEDYFFQLTEERK